MKPNSRLLLLIRNHEFMQPQGCDFMNLNACKKPYEVIERIFLNVAAKNGMKWTELIQTKYSDMDKFSELCVAVVLIDRYLYDLFLMSQRDRYVLIGFEYAKIIEEYYAFVGQK